MSNSFDYNNILSGLKESKTQIYHPDKVLNEKLDDAAIFGKQFLGSTGGMLEGEAIKKSFKLLGNSSKSVLAKLDLGQTDLEELSEKLSSGDKQGVMEFLSKRGLNVARKKVGAFVDKGKDLMKSLRTKATDQVKDVSEQAEERLGESPAVSATRRILGQAREEEQGQTEETEFPTEDTFPPAPQLPTATTDQTAMTDNVRDASGSQREPVEEDLLEGHGEGGGSAEAGNVVKGGKDVEKTLEGLTEDSLAEDETPGGILVTAGLGLATLIGGIFMKTHKDEYTSPPMPNQRVTGFASQAGY